MLALVALGDAAARRASSGAQDTSRLALTQSIVERGTVDIDPYWQLTIDRAFADGHWYSDKAPGVALLAVPVVAARPGGSHGRREAGLDAHAGRSG